MLTTDQRRFAYQVSALHCEQCVVEVKTAVLQKTGTYEYVHYYSIIVNHRNKQKHLTFTYTNMSEKKEMEKRIDKKRVGGRKGFE
jgi:copper chaperone CopZ